MSLIQFKYCHLGCPVAPCVAGDYELQSGDRILFTLDPKNPLWPDSVVADVLDVESTPQGRNYTVEYDRDLLNGGPKFEDCDIAEVDPYCCCDELKHKLEKLEETIPPPSKGDFEFDSVTGVAKHTSSNGEVDEHEICTPFIRTQTQSFDIRTGFPVILTDFDSAANQILDVYVDHSVVAPSTVSFNNVRTRNSMNTRFQLDDVVDEDYEKGLVVEFIPRCNPAEETLDTIILATENIINEITCVDQEITFTPVADTGNTEFGPALANDVVEGLLFAVSRESPSMFRVFNLGTFEQILEVEVDVALAGNPVSATAIVDRKEIYVSDASTVILVRDYEGNFIRQVDISQFPQVFDYAYDIDSQSLWGWGVLGLTQIDIDSGLVTVHPIANEHPDPRFLGITMDNLGNMILFDRDTAIMSHVNINDAQSSPETTFITEVGTYPAGVPVDTASDPRFSNTLTKLFT